VQELVCFHETPITSRVLVKRQIGVVLRELVALWLFTQRRFQGQKEKKKKNIS